jgi:hypothetical protein
VSDFNRAGTRVFWVPGDARKAEAGTGKAGGDKHLPEPLAEWMSKPDRACKDKPTLWWYAPEKENIELLDEDGSIVLDDKGKVVIAEQITLSTEADAKAAEVICTTCPHDLDCGEYGLRYEPCGIWGGIRLNTLNASQRADRLAGIARERQRRTRKQRPA